MIGRYLVLAILAAVVLSGCGPETPVPSGTGQAIDTAAPATVSAPTESAALSPVSEPTVDVSPIIAPILPTPTDVLVHPTPTLIPTPDVNAPGPELDGIGLVNPRPLLLPEGIEGYAFGVITWSPDGSQFLGNVVADEAITVGDAGYPVMDLYVGEGDTGEVSFLQHNAGWPSWSRDGRSIYFLKGHGDGQQVYYDLYRQSGLMGEAMLLAEDVGFGGPDAAVAEAVDGRLVLRDRGGQVTVLDGDSLIPIWSLVGNEEPSPNESEFFSLAPDGHTVAIGSLNEPLYIVDLENLHLVAQLDTIISSSDNIGWSIESDRIAYTTSEGVFVYDLQQGSQEVIVTRQNLGYPEQDGAGGFSLPIWSVSGDILLFVSGTPDWAYDDTGHRYWYLFAATSDKSQVKALSRSVPDAVAPDGSRAIVSEWDPGGRTEMKLLVDVNGVVLSAQP